MNSHENLVSSTYSNVLSTLHLSPHLILTRGLAFRKVMNPILLMRKQRLRETKPLSSSQSVVSGPADLTSPGNLLEMSILWPYPRPTQLETPCTRPAMNFNKPCRWLRCNLPKTMETEGSKHNFGSRYKGPLSYLQLQTPDVQNRQSLADACLLKMSCQIHKGDKKE